VIRRRRHHPRSREREREELPMKKENRDGREKLFFVVVRSAYPIKNQDLSPKKKQQSKERKLGFGGFSVFLVVYSRPNSTRNMSHFKIQVSIEKCVVKDVRIARIENEYFV